MSRLPKFTLTYHEGEDRWDLENAATNRVVRASQQSKKQQRAAFWNRRSAITVAP